MVDKNKRYRFSNSNGGYVIFDSNSYILEAKGFSSLMWTTSLNIDSDLVGKHIEELAEMLKNYGSRRDVYTVFEINVHLELLKEILKDSKYW